MTDAQLKSFYYDDLGWCGCCNPAAALEYMRDVLAAIKANNDPTPGQAEAILDGIVQSALGNPPREWDESRKRLEALLGGEEHGTLGLSYMYMLDAKELTEHGGNVMGCWLTDKGRDVLDTLTPLSSEDIERILDTHHDDTGTTL